VARVQGGDACARLVLDPAGGWAHLDVRTPGVRDRRRGDACNSAHRRDVAVHLLRRLLTDRKLRAAGADPARVRPGAPRGATEPMNGPIVRVFGLIVALFALLVVFTSRWTVFDSKKLNNNALNARTLIDELKIKRGRILADNGTVLAKSVP